MPTPNRSSTSILVSLAGAAALSCIACRLPAQEQYKRVHQECLRLVIDGKIDDALARIERVEKEGPEDPETAFVATVALAQAGRIDDAARSLERALALGLAPGRFLAGPRDLLAPVAGHASFTRVEAFLRGEALHGPLVGHVDSTSARIWLRAADEADVEVVVSTATDVADGRITRARTSAARDYTAVVALDGLAPDTRYHFRVAIAGAESPYANGGSFRTARPDGAPGRLTLAFGGGAGFVPQNERVWTTIGTFEPDLLLLLGDNVYSDDPTRPAMQRYCYYRRQSRPEFRDLVAHTPTYAIWDDHDFGTNDCWGGPEIDTPSWKRSVWGIFRENWANPAYGGGAEHPGCWYGFRRGDVEFFLLDGRYYRTDPKRDAPSMLGPLQKAWLKERLAASGATFKVLCSPVPWDFRTKGDSLDTWRGFADEREEIFSFIADQRIEGVVLLSADRHRSDAWRIERPKGYDLYELNSSRLTNQHVHATQREALVSYNAKQSFGLVTFDTTRPDPTVTYRVVTIDGEVAHTLEVRRSQLTFDDH